MACADGAMTDIDADHMTGQIDQWASAIARINGGIGLNQIIKCFTLGGEHRPIKRADNADSDGRASFQRQGIADCDD